MKRHRNFEFYAGEYLKEQGYKVEVTPGVADWGVDIFCEKDCNKYAVQVKMYGTSKTKISTFIWCCMPITIIPIAEMVCDI